MDWKNFKYLGHVWFYLLVAFTFCSHHAHTQRKFKQTGNASYYGKKFHGRQTANGEKFNMRDLTAAHRTLPFNTKVKVTNLKNNKSVIVRINDRGPFAKGRIIDLSRAAAEKIGLIADGVAMVEITEVGGGQKNKNKAKKYETRKNKKITHGAYYNYNFRRTKPKGYGVQVGSFSEQALAGENAKDYQIKYNNPVVIESTNKGLYRIIIGKFRKKKYAERLQKRLKWDFKDCFVVSYD